MLCVGGKSLLLLPSHHFNPNNRFSNLLRQSPNPKNNSLTLCCSSHDSSTPITQSPTPSPTPSPTSTPPLIRKRTRYRKMYPGESEGIVEEMRFVAMKLRNDKATVKRYSDSEAESTESDDENGDRDTWEPSLQGFLNYLVDSKLVFETLERIVDKSDDVSYAYFRKTGLERSEGLSNDLEWFRQQDIVIPEPGSPGTSYAGYLEQLAENSPPSFLCHFYNIYFAHISGGHVIAKQVSEKILKGRELDFCRWEGDALELLKDVREKLNMLGEGCYGHSIFMNQRAVGTLVCHQSFP